MHGPSAAPEQKVVEAVLTTSAGHHSLDCSRIVLPRIAVAVEKVFDIRHGGLLSIAVEVFTHPVVINEQGNPVLPRLADWIGVANDGSWKRFERLR